MKLDSICLYEYGHEYGHIYTMALFTMENLQQKQNAPNSKEHPKIIIKNEV